MRALVVGYGSIGARHTRILEEDGHDVGVVSRRPVDVSRRYGALSQAIREHHPEYVVIANRTEEHRRTVKELVTCGFEGVLLVEKPLFNQPGSFPPNGFSACYVAYNLRFHPGVQHLRQRLRGERVLSVQAYVGHYLPLWRPNRDYRTTYSARKEEGGGVLRDLSHELDYLNWILGGWKQAEARGGHLSSLEINTEDAVGILASFEKCPVATVHLNYLDRVGRRSVLVNTDARTLELNLTEGYIQEDGVRTLFEVGRDDTYRAQHAAILAGGGDACTAEEALDVLDLVAEVESSLRPLSLSAPAPIPSR
ncbi:Gfo/Idh/MocA family protein [Rubricoccus marinus]|uniref:Oxidoreductase n=1 Tax=Rubricoccus marinus TaxID=716817 RepID=A0A259U0C7_9BACT|nr:Gfo/Idh/MocA family oxidoreductase [Rubricoccus marinus]OZC03431.1 oxidoreductase [Rubricoccus marinus]